MLIDVPVPRKYTSSTRPSGCVTSIVDPGARSDTTDTPGATTSGLLYPWNRSLPDQLGTTSSAVDAVAPVSAAPTVTTYGSLPGEVTAPAPSLPADTTTVIPEAHAASTAADSGLNRYGIGASTPNDKLSTSMR